MREIDRLKEENRNSGTYALVKGIFYPILAAGVLFLWILQPGLASIRLTESHGYTAPASLALLFIVINCITYYDKLLVLISEENGGIQLFSRICTIIASIAFVVGIYLSFALWPNWVWGAAIISAATFLKNLQLLLTLPKEHPFRLGVRISYSRGSTAHKKKAEGFKRWAIWAAGYTVLLFGLAIAHALVINESESPRQTAAFVFDLVIGSGVAFAVVRNLYALDGARIKEYESEIEKYMQKELTKQSKAKTT